MSATMKIAEERAVESFRRMLREHITPDFHGEVGCKVTVREGQVTHVFTTVERNEKVIRDMRT